MDARNKLAFWVIVAVAGACIWALITMVGLTVWELNRTAVIG